MSSQGGTATRHGVSEDAVDALQARRVHDAGALAAARPNAERATRDLLRALLDPTATTVEIERRARAAYDATGVLWERAARVNE
jgi:hypothetical protein